VKPCRCPSSCARWRVASAHAYAGQLAARKNDRVWNTMVTGYAHNGQLSEAIVLFIQLIGCQEVPLNFLGCDGACNML
jgi:pentatricopeptide repeat protein